MGYLFENMEKMDIQEERRKTAEAREQLAQKTEEFIQIQIETCQELGAGQEIVLQKIQEKHGLSEEEARKKIKLYWKE